MKKLFVYITLLAAGLTGAEAQIKKEKNTTVKKAGSIKLQAPQAPVTNAPINLNNWGAYNAKNTKGRTLFIADPTITTLNRRANGENLPVNVKEILGVPKITYGIGNGQLLFRSRGATTSGTGTGSGMVGTGSSTGTLGTNGLALGVNGKSPYAGPIMDGIIVSGMPAGTERQTPRRAKKAKRD